jgi:hypothetical protein
MYVDFKVTVWERVEVSEEKVDEVLAKLNSGEITTANDLFEDELLPHVKLIGFVNETEEYVTPEENDGQSTIEAGYKGEKTLFTNEIK